MLKESFILRNIYNNEYIISYNYIEDHVQYETNPSPMLAYRFNDLNEVEKFLKLFPDTSFIIEKLVSYR